jgi:hypothetical protein
MGRPNPKESTLLEFGFGTVPYFEKATSICSSVIPKPQSCTAISIADTEAPKKRWADIANQNFYLAMNRTVFNRIRNKVRQNLLHSFCIKLDWPDLTRNMSIDRDISL